RPEPDRRRVRPRRPGAPLPGRRPGRRAGDPRLGRGQVLHSDISMMTGPLPPPVVAALLHAASATIHAELSALPAPLHAFHLAPGEWCVKEVLGHLIESEQRGFAGRIRIILAAGARAGEGLALEGWDQDAVARARDDCARDGAALADEFAKLRATSVSLVAGLAPADLSRGG